MISPWKVLQCGLKPQKPSSGVCGRAARRAWAYDSYDGKPPQRIVSVMTVTVSKSRKPELTKGELRRLFEEAWRNTATLQPTEN